MIPVLLIIAAFAGCTSKSNNGNGDTTLPPPTTNTMVKGVLCTIMPPPAATPGPIQVIMGNNPVNFGGTFWGPISQTVTITGLPSGNPPPFTGSNGATWGPFTANAPPQTQITVTAAISAPGTYATSPSIPRPPYPNLTGNDTTTFADATSTNTSGIGIHDTGATVAGGKK